MSTSGDGSILLWFKDLNNTIILQKLKIFKPFLNFFALCRDISIIKYDSFKYFYQMMYYKETMAFTLTVLLKYHAVGIQT